MMTFHFGQCTKESIYLIKTKTCCQTDKVGYSRAFSYECFFEATQFLK